MKGNRDVPTYILFLTKKGIGMGIHMIIYCNYTRQFLIIVFAILYFAIRIPFIS